MKFKIENPSHLINENPMRPVTYILEAEDTSTARELATARVEAESEEFCGDDLRITPLCPKCGEELTSIGIEIAGVVYFKEDDEDFPNQGFYASGGQESGSYTCGICKAKIGGYAGARSWGFRPDHE